MKKNHFFTPYAGNKRTEMREISKYIPTDVKIIVEPFAGSCALSYFIWDIDKENNTEPKKYILNDNNQYLQQLYETVRDPEKEKVFEDKVNKTLDLIRNDEKAKEVYNKLVNKDTFEGWFIGNKYYNVRPYLYPLGKSLRPLKLSESPIYEFYKEADITFTCKEGVECLMEFQNNPDAFIFLDPPYLLSYNGFYKDPKLDIFEYLVNGPSMNKQPAYIMVVVEENYIINLIFSDNKYYCKYYEKTYQTTKKLTRHKLVMNLRFSKHDKPTKIIKRIK